MCFCLSLFRVLGKTLWMHPTFHIKQQAPGFDRDDAIAWVQGENTMCVCVSTQFHFSQLYSLYVYPFLIPVIRNCFCLSNHRIEIWWFSSCSLSFILCKNNVQWLTDLLFRVSRRQDEVCKCPSLVIVPVSSL